MPSSTDPPAGSRFRLSSDQIVQVADCAAFATDESDRITAWNEAASCLFSFSCRDAVGRTFGELLRPRDVYGNRLPDGTNGLHTMVRRYEAIHPFELDLCGRDGDRLRVTIAPVVVFERNGDGYHLVYLVQQPKRHQQFEQFFDRLINRPISPDSDGQGLPSLGGLTRRELQVLRLLAAAKSTPEISAILGISPSTVRNHIQNVLRKMGVHSKVEAVSILLGGGADDRNDLESD